MKIENVEHLLPRVTTTVLLGQAIHKTSLGSDISTGYQELAEQSSHLGYYDPNGVYMWKSSGDHALHMLNAMFSHDSPALEIYRTMEVKDHLPYYNLTFKARLKTIPLLI